MADRGGGGGRGHDHRVEQLRTDGQRRMSCFGRGPETVRWFFYVNRIVYFMYGSRGGEENLERFSCPSRGFREDLGGTHAVAWMVGTLMDDDALVLDGGIGASDG